MAALVPLPHPLGLNSLTVTPQQTSLSIQARLSFSGGDFHIKDGLDRDIVFCKGKAISMSERTEFFMPGQNPTSNPPLFTLRKHRLVILGLTRFYLQTQPQPQSPASESPPVEIAQINRKFHIGGLKIHITFNNTAHDGAPVELTMKGSWFDRTATVTWGDVVVAHVRKNVTMGSLLLGQDRYGIEVAAGCDLVFFGALIVAFDEAYRAKGRGGVMSG